MTIEFSQIAASPNLAASPTTSRTRSLRDIVRATLTIASLTRAGDGNVVDHYPGQSTAGRFHLSERLGAGGLRTCHHYSDGAYGEPRVPLRSPEMWTCGEVPFSDVDVVTSLKKSGPARVRLQYRFVGPDRSVPPLHMRYRTERPA